MWRANQPYACASFRQDHALPRTARAGPAAAAREECTMPSRAIHPGEHLAEELDALDMSAAELARRLKVPTNRVTAIMNGQRAISGDTALRLAHFFGTSPQFWLNLQSLYEIRLAEEKSGKAIKKLPSLKRVQEVHA